MNRFTFLFTTTLLWLLLCRCNTSSSLTDEEKKFAGAWRHEINMLPGEEGKAFGYLELTEQRTGVNGMVVTTNGKQQVAPYLSYEITNWRIHKDTLILDCTMKAKGMTFVGPGGKDSTMTSDLHHQEYWIIKEKSEEEFTAENIDPSLPHPFQVQFARTAIVEQDQ